MTKEEIENIPVTSCKYCNSLHIWIDDLGNDLCANCGAINEVVVHNNINEYLEEIKEEE